MFKFQIIFISFLLFNIVNSKPTSEKEIKQVENEFDKSIDEIDSKNINNKQNEIEGNKEIPKSERVVRQNINFKQPNLMLIQDQNGIMLQNPNLMLNERSNEFDENQLQVQYKSNSDSGVTVRDAQGRTIGVIVDQVSDGIAKGLAEGISTGISSGVQNSVYALPDTIAGTLGKIKNQNLFGIGYGQGYSGSQGYLNSQGIGYNGNNYGIKPGFSGPYSPSFIGGVSGKPILVSGNFGNSFGGNLHGGNVYTEIPVGYFKTPIVNAGLGHGINIGLNSGYNTGIGHGINSGIGHGMNSGIGYSVNSGKGHGINLGISHGINSGFGHGTSSGISFGQGLNTGLGYGQGIYSGIKSRHQNIAAPFHWDCKLTPVNSFQGINSKLHHLGSYKENEDADSKEEIETLREFIEQMQSTTLDEISAKNNMNNIKLNSLNIKQGIDEIAEQNIGFERSNNEAEVSEFIKNYNDLIRELEMKKNIELLTEMNMNIPPLQMVDQNKLVPFEIIDNTKYYNQQEEIPTFIIPISQIQQNNSIENYKEQNKQKNSTNIENLKQKEKLENNKNVEDNIKIIEKNVNNEIDLKNNTKLIKNKNTKSNTSQYKNMNNKNKIKNNKNEQEIKNLERQNMIDNDDDMKNIKQNSN